MKQIIKQEIINWLKIIVFSLAFAFTINNYVIVNANIPSGSMENTLSIGDRIIAFRWSYLIADPQRFDIMIFKHPDDESTLLIKRVIGLPGEKVEIKGGKVYIDDNNTYIDDSFIKDTSSGNFGPYYVPENSYFVLGDNRNASNDSRLWENTFVSKDKIIGKAKIKYFPKINIIK